MNPPQNGREILGKIWIILRNPSVLSKLVVLSMNRISDLLFVWPIMVFVGTRAPSFPHSLHPHLFCSQEGEVDPAGSTSAGMMAFTPSPEEPFLGVRWA